jgi:hypothetical protein
MVRTKEGKLADDILVGAKAIAEEAGLSQRQVYAYQKELGLTHMGSLLVGSKSGMRQRLTGKAD